MSAVFRFCPVLVRLFWIAAAIALAVPVALAEDDGARPVTADEFNRQVERQDKKLDDLSAKMEKLSDNMAKLSENMAALMAQMEALAATVEKQGGRIDNMREELSAIYLAIIAGVVMLAVGLMGIVGVLIFRRQPALVLPAGNASPSAESQRTAIPAVSHGSQQSEWHREMSAEPHLSRLQ